jgi:hypothetical protein
MPARMIVIAGPPGSGKSSIFPLSSFGVACFNADDRAAELNNGSYVGIPRHIRQAVNHEFEAFVLASIKNRRSFTILYRESRFFTPVFVATCSGPGPACGSLLVAAGEGAILAGPAAPQRECSVAVSGAGRGKTEVQRITQPRAWGRLRES